jgi:lysophospholipase L1-like esterase
MKKVLFFCVSLLFCEIGFSQTKILSLGESTTDFGPSYRRKMCELLTADGISFNMVGPKNDGATTYDGDHAGYSGRPCDFVQLQLESFYASYPADIILIWEGTNDCGWATVGGSITPLSTLVDKACQLYPNAKVLVASIPPMSYNAYESPADGRLPGVAQANGVAYNNAMPGMCNTKFSAGKKVYYVNATSLTLATDISSDGIHPNQVGYDKMGTIFYNAVKTALGSAPATNLGFEDNFTSWSTYGTASISTTAANVRSGTKSGFFSNGGANYTVTGLTPGATYSLKGWVKAVSGPDIFITLNNYGGGGQVGQQMTSTNWTQSGDIVFTMGASNTSVMVSAWTGATSSAYFDDYVVSPYNQSGITGNVNLDTWTNIGGTTISNIPINTTPNSTTTLTSLEIPSNSSDSYGVRIRGYIVPTTTGNYTFYVAGDDNSEFYLSSNNLPANATRIAYHNDWTNAREWTKYPTQTSTVRSLTAGQKYFFKAYMKEGFGGDNLAIGWTGPGIGNVTVIGASNLDKYIPTGASGEMTADKATINTPVAVSGVSIYPNPASNSFNVSNTDANASISVTTLAGKAITSVTANGNLTTIDSSNWSAGVYIIQVQSGASTTVKKVVIAK